MYRIFTAEFRLFYSLAPRRSLYLYYIIFFTAVVQTIIIIILSLFRLFLGVPAQR